MSGSDPSSNDQPTLDGRELLPSTVDSSSPQAAGHPAPKQGDLIGRFVVIERLGEGGMGTVYAARDPMLDRKVALKLLHRTLSEEGYRIRLAREAQALARLSHPNVVAVHDVGLFEGQMFLAMEHIDGEPLSELLRAPPPWARVLELFIEAGQGLHAAHCAGLVHRDFKPQNVMIGKDGHARVVDFGLARDTGEVVSDPARACPPANLLSSPLTHTGALLGTPVYMPPEQFERRQCDARGDQFSFCVALWEGLYGLRPYQAGSLAELRALVASGRPGLPPKGTGVPGSLHRALLKGLAPSPLDRYPTMTALLQALRRRPARAPVRIFQAAAGLTLAGLGAFGALQWSARAADRCRSGAQRLAETWNPEVKQRLGVAFAESGLPFAGEAFGRAAIQLDGFAADWGAMHREACEATRVRREQSEQLLDWRTACLETRRAELGSVVQVFGRPDREVIEGAVMAVRRLTPIAGCADLTALAAAVTAPLDPAKRRAVEALGARLAEAKALKDLGKPRAGREAALAAAAEARRLSFAPSLAEAQLLLATLERQLGAGKEASAAIDEALIAAEAAGDVSLAARARIERVRVVGVVLDQHDEAVREARLAEASLQRLGNPPLLLGRLLETRARVDRKHGSTRAALENARAAFTLRERAFPSESEEVLESTELLVDLYLEYGDVVASQQFLGRLLEVRRRVLGSQHPDVGRTLRQRAQQLTEQGNYLDAVDDTTEALKILTAALGPDHLEVAGVYRVRASTRLALGHLDAALADSLELSRINQAQPEPDVARLAMVHVHLGYVYLRREESAKAEAEFQRALELFRHSKHRGTPYVLTLINIAVVRYKSGQVSEVVRDMELARAELEASGGQQSAQMALVLNNLGALNIDLGRYDLARGYLEQGMALRVKISGPSHLEIGRLWLNFGGLDQALGQLDRAKESFQKGLDLYSQLRVADDELATALTFYGDFLVEAEQLEPALENHHRAMEMRERLYGDSSPLLAENLAGIARALVLKRRAAEALPLARRAVGLRRGVSVDALSRGHTASVLARAIIETAGDRTEARAVADEARRHYEEQPVRNARYLADLAAWRAKVKL